MDDSDKENLSQETLARQFRIVRRKTDKSHVQSFGSINVKHEHVSEFMGSKVSINRRGTIKNKRRYLETQITQIVEKLISDPVEQLQTITIYPESITDKGCHHSVMHTFNKYCFNFSENAYAMKYAFVLTNLCEKGIEAYQIEEVMKNHCKKAGTHNMRGII
uniref:Late expression factor 11 n=1 Tax=Meloidogyne hapla TaxID=6305 RepID=A0A1I8AYK1_MELHA